MRRQYDALQSSSGFALVGVVMFVLVLTILGLSLFSLTSFESQFVTMSESQSEAFFAASDAIDRARFTLVATGSLETVHTMLPDGTVIYARAKQGHELNFKDLKDSTGTVDWDGSDGDVWIRTLAVRRGQRTLLEARFTPHEQVDYYHRLLTLTGGLTIVGAAPVPPDPTPVARLTTLVGPAWINGPIPPGCWSDAGGPGVAPVPNVSTYIAIHSAGAIAADYQGNSEHWTLDASGAQYKFFHNGPNGPYSINSVKPNPTISVSGIAIWLLDRGIRADDKITVSGSGALMIVAGKTTDIGAENQDRGFNLLGGLTSTIPIILVSDGIVGIEHKNNTLGEPSLMPMVSIYARDAYFMGPAAPLAQSLSYAPGVGQIIDTLLGLDLLPNVSNGVLSRLEREPGTWRDITESNPN